MRIRPIGCLLTNYMVLVAHVVEYWNEVPMFSQNPEGSRDAIHSHVKQLVDELAAE